MRPRTVLVCGAVLAATVVGFTLLQDDAWPAKQKLDADRAHLEARAQELTRQNVSLRARAATLRDDRADNRVLERAVRSELGYVKPDEVVVFTDEATAPATGDAKAANTEAAGAAKAPSQKESSPR